MYRLPPSYMSSSPLRPADNRDYLFQEEEANSLRDYWIVIRKYRWTIVMFLLPIVVITGIFEASKPRVYTATVALHFDPQTPNIIGASELLALGERAFDAYYKTQIDLLMSRSLAAKVFQNLGL